MKAFQSLASTVIHGVQNTYTAYNKGYYQETPAEANDTAILEEDERDRRLADAQGEQDKEVLAAKTSVMFQAAAVPHNSMATIVEKAREQRVATLEGDVQPTQPTSQASDLVTLMEGERERRSLDSAEAQSREAVAAQVSVLLKAANFGNARTDYSNHTANVDQSLTEMERARRIADVQEAQNREALAAKTSVLILNPSAQTSDLKELLPTQSVSNLSAMEGENLSALRNDSNPIHPGIETPLTLRDDTPIEVRRDEAIVNEVAVRDSFPVFAHDESHVVHPSSIIEKLSIAAPQTFTEMNEAQYQPNVMAIPEITTQEQTQTHVVPEYQPEVMNYPQTWSQSNNMQAYSEVQPRSIPTPPHVESHATTSSVQLYPMVVQRMEASSIHAGITTQTPPMSDNTRCLIPTGTSQPYQSVPSVEQYAIPTLSAPAPAPALAPAPVVASELHVSSIAKLQADAMEQTNSAPATEWIESHGHPSTANNAPVMPVLLKSLSAKDLKQINRNINSHHNDALKEVRKAEKSLAKVEKYTAKGNTSKAEKYQREYMDHKSRATQHEHVVVEEKAKIAAIQTIAATPAL